MKTAGRFLLGVIFGGGSGYLLGCLISCTGERCPLLCHPLRGALLGAVMGLLFALLR